MACFFCFFFSNLYLSKVKKLYVLQCSFYQKSRSHAMVKQLI